MVEVVRTRAAIVLLALLLSAPSAHAAACCMSATAFGVGRLLAWEDVATGVQVGHSRVLGQWDAAGRYRDTSRHLSEGLTRVEPWLLVRLQERWQVQARLPVLLNDRAVGPSSELAGGLGDVGAALRFEALSVGEYEHLPSLGLTLGVLAPTGRRVEQATGLLGAGVTGRGAFGASLALESEYAVLPWYVRLDAGVTVFAPFRRSDSGASQWYGPLVQAALSGGREVVADKLVWALSAQLEWEAPLHLDGELVPGSHAMVPSLSTSLSWRVQPHLTLVASVVSTVWPSGFAQNRDARLGLVLGGRYGFF